MTNLPRGKLDMRRRFLMAALAALGGLAALTQPATAQVTQPTENLKLAMDVGFAPFAYRDAKGETVGFTVDFAKEIAKRLGRPGVEIIDQPYAGIFAGLFAKRCGQPALNHLFPALRGTAQRRYFPFGAAAKHQHNRARPEHFRSACRKPSRKFGRAKRRI